MDIMEKLLKDSIKAANWKRILKIAAIVAGALAALAVLVPYKVEKDEEKTDLTALLWRGRKSKKLGTSIIFGTKISDEELEESLLPDEEAEAEETPAEAVAEAPVEEAPVEEAPAAEVPAEAVAEAQEEVPCTEEKGEEKA